MDVKWIVDDHVAMFKQGILCERKACEAIMNAIAFSEQEVIAQYAYARNAIETICASKPELSKVFCKMINNIIEDEGNHQASAAKAAAICAGYNAAKPKELKEAGNIETAGV